MISILFLVARRINDFVIQNETSVDPICWTKFANSSRGLKSPRFRASFPIFSVSLLKSLPNVPPTSVKLFHRLELKRAILRKRGTLRQLRTQERRKKNGNGTICMALPPPCWWRQTAIEIRNTWNLAGEGHDSRASWNRNLNFGSRCAITPTRRLHSIRGSPIFRRIRNRKH